MEPLNSEKLESGVFTQLGGKVAWRLAPWVYHRWRRQGHENSFASNIDAFLRAFQFRAFVNYDTRRYIYSP